MMNCGNIDVGFTDGGICKLSLERFGNVTELAVNNCLVLKTLTEDQLFN